MFVSLLGMMAKSGSGGGLWPVPAFRLDLADVM